MSLLGKASPSIRDNHHWGLSFPLKDPESKDTCNDVRVLHTKFFCSHTVLPGLELKPLSCSNWALSDVNTMLDDR